ncbi:hypothetical protein BDZ89DRAFT_1073482 [Hymenopellis radicata]|nr:hypothetical protein BDZ89DRAFT_1073482 [Hymenopellis radicata]
MNSRLELPAELWSEILGSVCRIWNNIISCILFNTLYLPWKQRNRVYSGHSFQPLDQERLKSSIDLLRHIASSPNFGRHFEVISIDTDLCSQVSCGQMPRESTSSWKSRITAIITRKRRRDLWACIQDVIPHLTSLRRMDIPWSHGLCPQMEPMIASLPPLATLAVDSKRQLFPFEALSQLRGLTTLQAGSLTKTMNYITPIITNNPQLKKIDLKWWEGEVDLRALFAGRPLGTPACVESFVGYTLTVSDATSRFPHFRHLTSLQVDAEAPEALWDILRRETVHLVRVHICSVSIAFVRYVASYRGIERLELKLWAVKCPANVDSLWQVISLHKASLCLLALGSRICTLCTPTIRHLQSIPSVSDPPDPSKIDAELKEGERIVNEFLDHLEDWPELEAIMLEHEVHQYDSDHVWRIIEGQSFGDCRRLEIRIDSYRYEYSQWPRIRHCLKSAYAMMRLHDGSFAFRIMSQSGSLV